MPTLPMKPANYSLTQRIAQPRPVPPPPSSVPGLAATPAHDRVGDILRERRGETTPPISVNTPEWEEMAARTGLYDFPDPVPARPPRWPEVWPEPSPLDGRYYEPISLATAARSYMQRHGETPPWLRVESPWTDGELPEGVYRRRDGELVVLKKEPDEIFVRRHYPRWDPRHVPGGVLVVEGRGDE